MIKMIETSEDLKAILDICPELGLCDYPLHTDEKDGLLDSYENGIGVFYDDQKKDIFSLQIVYAEHDDLSFVMKESKINYTDECMIYPEQSVFEWFYGKTTKEEVLENIAWKNKQK